MLCPIWGFRCRSRTQSSCLRKRDTDRAGIKVFSVAREPFAKFESGVRQVYHLRFIAGANMTVVISTSLSADDFLDAVLATDPWKVGWTKVAGGGKAWGVADATAGHLEISGRGWINEHFEPSTARMSGAGYDGAASTFPFSAHIARGPGQLCHTQHARRGTLWTNLEERPCFLERQSLVLATCPGP